MTIFSDFVQSTFPLLTWQEYPTNIFRKIDYTMS